MAACGQVLREPWKTPFIGRAAELEDLTGQLERAQRGQTTIALLAGEPGIGKTRIAEELCAVAAQRGARVFWGQCFEGEGAPSFWPWVQVLRSWIRPLDAHRSVGASGPGRLYHKCRWGAGDR
jgi:eukaryotic-like serine/threonine-protein kinase